MKYDFYIKLIVIVELQISHLCDRVCKLIFIKNIIKECILQHTY